MPTQDHELSQLANGILGEIQGDASNLGKLFVNEVLPDQKELSKPELLRYVRAKWNDPASPEWIKKHPEEPFWRQEQLARVGPKQFVEMANAAWDVPKPPSPKELADAGEANPPHPLSVAAQRVPPPLLGETPAPGAPAAPTAPAGPGIPPPLMG